MSELAMAVVLEAFYQEHHNINPRISREDIINAMIFATLPWVVKGR